MQVSRTSARAGLGHAAVLVLALAFGLCACPENPPQTPSERVSRERPDLASLLDARTIPPRGTIKRTTILNTLADRYGYRSYLEIGQGRKEDNFAWVTCRKKVGVDPNKEVEAAFPVTSDEYFARHRDAFDLIFVDGLHLADQAERDILNALRVLNTGGTIVVHDCNPTTEEMQRVPWQGQHAWTGDVWKVWVKMRATRADLQMFVVDVDSGCGIIRRGRQRTMALPEELTYEAFAKNRRKWLNLLDVHEFLGALRRSR